jgi:hypothetical protein
VLAAVTEATPADLTEALAKLTSAEFLDEQALTRSPSTPSGIR